MSAHGISPTWRQSNQFANGEDWAFQPTAIISIFLNCDFKVDDADISVEVTTLSLNCDFKVEAPDILIEVTVIDLDCSFKVDDPDIAVPITIISLTCFTETV